VTATDFSGNEGEESSLSNAFAGLPGRPDAREVPAAFALRQNRPNPFDAETVVGFDLPEARWVSLTVYDAEGRLVKRLVDSEYAPGYHRAVWDGIDARGKPVSTGVYFIRMRAGSYDAMKKVTLIR
jgi:hypothetical protein